MENTAENLDCLPPIKIVLVGEPQGWERNGVRIITPRGKKPFPVIYTKSATRNYQEALAAHAALAMRGREVLDEPLTIRVTAVMGVPASWSLKKREQALAGLLRPTGKPDFDNLAKMVDALKGIVWRDDALVVTATIRKVYGSRPQLRIDVGPADIVPPIGLRG